MRFTQDPAEWGRIRPYIDRALELRPDERESWLLELAATHPDIAPVVQSMLAEREQLDAKGFLAHSPLGAANTPSRVGAQVGAYLIERAIGRGGMGEVWLARRIDGRFEGLCAIKFLDASFAAPRLADRFRREGQLLARLTHPNIARLLDAGTADDGTPYLALEYVDGLPIDRYCDGEKLSTEARVRVFLDVIAAVAHAHSHLIVHRDLKPSNVLVTADGQVKLLDFGIAKLLGAGDGTGTVADNDERTRLGETLLTPEYAAPEQILGETPSTATDVYQLGMLLYVLLAGRHPLRAGGTRSEGIRAALDGVVPRASSVADSNTARGLRGDLDFILETALRKNSTERYATAQAFQEELQRYLNREPVLARRGAVLYRARKFVGRHRVAVGSAAAIAITLVAGIIGTAWQSRVAADRAQRLQVTKNFLIDVFRVNSSAQPDPLKAQQTTARELLDRAAQRIVSQLDDAPQDSEELLKILGDLHLELGLPQRSSELRAMRIGVLDKLYGSSDSRLVEPLLDHADSLYFTKASGEALTQVRRAGALLDASGDTTSALRARHWRLLGLCSLGRDFERAREYSSASVELYRRHPDHKAELVGALRLAAAAATGSNLRAAALPLLLEALQLHESIGGTDSTQLQLRVDIAEIQTDLMQLDAAEQNFRRALSLTKRINGDLHMESLQTSMRFGIHLRKSGRLLQAQEVLTVTQANAIQAVTEQDAYSLPAIRMELARVELMLGNFAAAADLYRRAIEARQAARSGDYQHANMLQNYAAALVEMGRVDDGIRLATQAAAMFTKAKTPVGTTLVPIVLAAAHTSAGRSREALDALDRHSDGAERLEVPVQIRVEIRRGAALAEVSAAESEALLKNQLQRLGTLPQPQRFRWIEGDARMVLGRLLTQSNRADAACELLGPVVQWRTEDLSSTSALLADSQVALAECRLKQGNAREADELHRRARAIYATHPELGLHYTRPFEDLQRQLRRR
jgi:serine/threonine protein kinase/tetratricopeptide (TPR) repeat protein